MNKFIKKLVIFALMISVVITGSLFYFYKIGGNDLPAPNFSNSISFNEKIDFITNKDLSKIEYAVIGSSMSLNNIDSETMVKYFGENYINLASWGFKISDSESYLNNMIGLFPNLKMVIVSTSFMDFSSSARNITVDYSFIKNSIKNKLKNLTYLWSFDLRYLYNSAKKNINKKMIKNSYQNLVFDEYGGAVLSIDSDKVNPDRWVNDIMNFDVSDEELGSLAELIQFVEERNIKTVIAFNPQRNGMINDEKMIKINSKIERIRNVAEKNKGLFINSFEFGGWDDSLFVDYVHLNKQGAAKYSEIIAKSILFLP